MRDTDDRQLWQAGRRGRGRARRPTASRSSPKSRAKVKAWVKQADPRVTGEALYEDMTTDLRPDMAAIATPITLVYPWSAPAAEGPAPTRFYTANMPPRRTSASCPSATARIS